MPSVSREAIHCHTLNHEVTHSIISQIAIEKLTVFSLKTIANVIGRRYNIQHTQLYKLAATKRFGRNLVL